MWDELPPCFAAHCERCGWKGRLPSPLYYVVGAHTPIREVDLSNGKCPACGRTACRKMDHASLVARLRYVVDHLAQVPGREPGCDVFPCSCPHTPPCRLAGEVRLALASYSDSFCCDEDWTRVRAAVKCNGCHAQGMIALLEKHPSMYLWRLDRDQYNHLACASYAGLVIG